jgi:hypothetical protein
VTGETILRTKLKWLTGLRVVVVTVFLGLFLALNNGTSAHSASRLFAALIVGTYALTIVYALALKWLNSKWDSFVAIVQITGDLACITSVVASTGGIESPFTFLYLSPSSPEPWCSAQRGFVDHRRRDDLRRSGVALVSGPGRGDVVTHRGELASMMLRALAFAAVFLLSNHLWRRRRRDPALGGTREWVPGPVGVSREHRPEYEQRVVHGGPRGPGDVL